MYLKLICLVLITTTLFSSGGYDNGTSAGKGKWDLSLTLNPFNYFAQGQSYLILGYGLTDQFDIHGYYSYFHKGEDNYYFGLFYQFYKSKRLNLSTAIGIRKYRNQSTTHLFFPQLLYTLKLRDKLSLGGSFVDIRNQSMNNRIGVAEDVFLMWDLYENDKYKINVTAGVFNPVLWQPSSGNWYPTYSIDIKIK